MFGELAIAGARSHDPETIVLPCMAGHTILYKNGGVSSEWYHTMALFLFSILCHTIIHAKIVLSGL